MDSLWPFHNDAGGHFGFTPLEKNAGIFARDTGAKYFLKGSRKSNQSSKHLSQKVVMKVMFFTLLLAYYIYFIDFKLASRTVKSHLSLGQLHSRYHVFFQSHPSLFKCAGCTVNYSCYWSPHSAKQCWHKMCYLIIIEVFSSRRHRRWDGGSYGFRLRFLLLPITL